MASYVPKGTRFRMIAFLPDGTAISFLKYKPVEWGVVRRIAAHRWIGEGDGKARDYAQSGAHLKEFDTRQLAAEAAERYSKVTYGEDFPHIKAGDTKNGHLRDALVYDTVELVALLVIDRFKEKDAPREKGRPVLDGYRARFDALNSEALK